MNKLLPILIGGFALLLTQGQAQEFQKISCGANYKFQSYVNLEKGTEKQVNNETWDIAFTAMGTSDAGIFINESSTSSTGENLPQTELYDAKTTDFDANIDVASIVKNIYYNSEISWNYGAFNEGRNLADPFDYGWGKYNPQNHSVIGENVYVLKLRNGKYKKIQIESLAGIVYNFKYADLDGSNLVTKSINKQTENYGQNLIFYSFDSNSTIDILPQDGFDLMYGRYISWAKDPNGTIEQFYNVTGVLTGPGIKAAVAKGVNPDTVVEKDVEGQYSTRIDVIGFDWKNFIGTKWSIEQDRAHFLKMPDNTVWKLVFIDFEGSATGNAVFQKTKLGTSATTQITGIEAGIFPNPVENSLYITIDADQNAASNLGAKIMDIQGRVVFESSLDLQAGLNAFEFNTSILKSGTFVLQLNNGKEVTTKKFVKL
ncbi:MAG: T9SS type A sorting domain-containing protein [Chitinophagales bacterium]|nr:T9SS type A sorting domain-containing protein [Chitinophagales bacterium]